MGKKETQKVGLSGRAEYGNSMFVAGTYIVDEKDKAIK